MAHRPTLQTDSKTPWPTHLCDLDEILFETPPEISNFVAVLNIAFSHFRHIAKFVSARTETS